MHDMMNDVPPPNLSRVCMVGRKEECYGVKCHKCHYEKCSEEREVGVVEIGRGGGSAVRWVGEGDMFGEGWDY